MTQIVSGGPFVGMVMSDAQPWNDGNAEWKLNGQYEAELHGVVLRAVKRRPKLLINVGCAEGYYAVGFARLLPNLRVVAVDVSPACLDVCSANARLNDVTLLGIPGVTPTQLAYLVEPKTLIVMDCEGAEVAFCNPAKYGRLKDADIIVECHDFFDPRISPTLFELLSQTHDAELIDPQPGGETRPAATKWIAAWSRNHG